MKRLWPWAVAASVIAIAGHLILVINTPWLVNAMWVAKLRAAGVAMNEMGHMKRPKIAGKDVVGYDNPDNLSSFLLFDVSKSPIRIHARVVREAAYWSVCFVDDKTDVFGLVRDSDISGDYVTVVLAKPSQRVAAAQGEKVIYAPTNTGIVLFRVIMPDRTNIKAVAKLVALNADASVEVIKAP